MAKEKNIFETAANQLGKKKPIQKENVKPSRPVSGRHSDPETREMLDKIKDMQQDLQSKLEYIEQKKELLGPAISKYLDESKSLTPAEAKFLEANKSLLGNKITSAIGVPPKTTEDKGPSKPTNRKGKTLGARKKWMPVR